MAGYEPDAVVTARSNGRRRRTAITMVSLVLLLFFAFWYALSYFRSSTAAPPTASATPCVTINPGSIVPQTTHLNVYNATKRNGLAASTARELELRGFVVATIANDPLHKSVPDVVQIRYGAKGDKRALLVKKQFPDKVSMVKDKRTDETVDVVLGEAFRALAPTPTPTASPTPACTTTAAGASTSPSISPSASTSASP